VKRYIGETWIDEHDQAQTPAPGRWYIRGRADHDAVRGQLRSYLLAGHLSDKHVVALSVMIDRTDDDGVLRDYSRAALLTLARRDTKMCMATLDKAINLAIGLGLLARYHRWTLVEVEGCDRPMPVMRPSEYRFTEFSGPWNIEQKQRRKNGTGRAPRPPSYRPLGYIRRAEAERREAQPRLARSPESVALAVNESTDKKTLKGRDSLLFFGPPNGESEVEYHLRRWGRLPPGMT
jgi:hypothetical protein